MGQSYRHLGGIIGVIVILIITPVMVQADVPQLINFQGKLIEDDVAITGYRTMTLSLWDTDTGGLPSNAIWYETQASVEIIEGIYNVQIGSVNLLPSNLYTYDQLYLQIDIVHPTLGSQRLSPLLELTSAVFALKAGDADMLDGKTADDFAQKIHNHSGSDITTGVVADSRIASTIARDSEITWSNLSGVPAGFADGMDNTGITSETDPTVDPSVKDGVSWTELSGIPAGFTDGIDNDSGGDITEVSAGTGLVGGGSSGNVTLDVEIPFSLTSSNTAALISATNNTASTGYGIYGESAGSTGYGVYGKATGSAGIGVFGETAGSSANAVQGLSLGSDGSGVVGYAFGASGRGIEGYAYSSNGWAVYGEASDTGDGTNIGGYFIAKGADGRGVTGWAEGDGDNYGGYFIANGTNGRGVYGLAPGTNGQGVYGFGGQYDFYAAGPGNNYGPFTGAHEVRFAEGMTGKINPGMIVSVTGRAEVRKKANGEISLSSTLPTVTLAGRAMDKAVLGVLVSEGSLPNDHWYEAQEDEHFGVVNALGEGRVLVTNANGEIEAGDYITTSAIPGYGQKQDDDLLHCYTLGKAIETVDWELVSETVEFNGVFYKVYLIAVVYTSG